MGTMSIELKTPRPDELSGVLRALREWQHDGTGVQLHPGDVGWFWRFGSSATAEALRVWSRDGAILVVGLLDGPDVLRLAMAPGALEDADAAEQVVGDVLERREITEVEARFEGALPELLRARGWKDGESWTPLARDLREPVPESGLRVEVVEAQDVPLRVAVHVASFTRSTFTAEHWHDMASGEPYADAHCLLGYDDSGEAVAAATVWSAGEGRPGLLEPVGVHQDHRGHGYGTAIGVAAAAALRGLGSSTALVCTPSANTVAVATYRSAGFLELPVVPDFHRDPSGSSVS